MPFQIEVSAESTAATRLSSSTFLAVSLALAARRRATMSATQAQLAPNTAPSSSPIAKYMCSLVMPPILAPQNV